MRAPPPWEPLVYPEFWGGFRNEFPFFLVILGHKICRKATYKPRQSKTGSAREKRDTFCSTNHDIISFYIICHIHFINVTHLSHCVGKHIQTRPGAVLAFQ